MHGRIRIVDETDWTSIEVDVFGGELRVRAPEGLVGSWPVRELEIDRRDDSFFFTADAERLHLQVVHADTLETQLERATRSVLKARLSGDPAAFVSAATETAIPPSKEVGSSEPPLGSRPGWYHARDGDGYEWWTGQAWSGARSATTAQASPRRKSRVLLLVAAIVLVVMVANLGDSTTPNSEPVADVEPASSGQETQSAAAAEFSEWADRALPATYDAVALLDEISASAGTGDLTAVLNACAKGRAQLPNWRASSTNGPPSVMVHLEAAWDAYEQAFELCSTSNVDNLEASATYIAEATEHITMATEALTSLP